jgi:hypothetical protein
MAQQRIARLLGSAQSFGSALRPRSSEKNCACAPRRRSRPLGWRSKKGLSQVANLAVALAAASDGLFVAGLEDGIELSVDGGATWARAWQADGAVFGLSTGARYAAGAGGVLRRAGDSWKTVNAAPARAVCHSGRRAVALTLAHEVLLTNDDDAT